MRQVAQEGLKELSDYPWDFMLLAAELYIRSGDLADAEHCIKQMNQKEILPAMVAYLEGLVADRRDNGYEAVRCWQRSIELGNRSLQTRLALATEFSRLGNTQLALRQLKILVSEMPDSFDARFALATMLAKAGRWTELEEQSQQALSISPGHLGVMLLNLQAQIQLLATSGAGADAQLWREIETQLEKLDQASNGALDVKFMKFQYALFRGNYTEAENLLSELKEHYPLDAALCYGKRR
jgi:tetratricopeptide (TPR) repeat protein